MWLIVNALAALGGEAGLVGPQGPALGGGGPPARLAVAVPVAALGAEPEEPELQAEAPRPGPARHARPRAPEPSLLELAPAARWMQAESALTAGWVACLLIAGLAASHGRSKQDAMGVKSVFAGHRFLQVLTTAEYGCFPAASIFVQKELGMSEIEFGLIGTLTSTGIVCSSLVAPWLFSKFDSMEVSRMCCSLSIAANMATVCAPNNHALLAARFLAGFAHGPLYVYFPVWIDTFAPAGLAARWLGIFAVLGCLANLGAYALTAAFVYGLEVSWRWSYGFLSAGVLGVALVCDAVPAHLWRCEAPKGLDFGPVLTKPTFWCLTLVIALQWYTLSAVEYFCVSFLHELGASEGYAAKLYIFAGVGVALGIFCGSWLNDRFGGYNNRASSLLLCLVITVLPLPALPWLFQVQDATHAMVFGSVFMILYASINPVVIGLALRIAPRHRTQASAVLNFVSTALGFMLGPSVAGYVAHTKGLRQAWAMTFIPSTATPALLSAVACAERTLGEPEALPEDSKALLVDGGLREGQNPQAA